jgi:hypothetical protein
MDPRHGRIGRMLYGYWFRIVFLQPLSLGGNSHDIGPSEHNRMLRTFLLYGDSNSEKLGPLDDLNTAILKHSSPAFTLSVFLMADENSLPLTNSNGQRQAPSALQLGPRKKPFVCMSISFWFLPRDAYHLSDVSVIHLSPMAVTFVGQHTHYVMSKRSSQMASCGWASRLMSLKNLLLSSMLTLCFFSFPSDYFTHRQRREHRVFRTLLHMVPGLEERLIAGSDDEAVVVAELVSTSI